MFNLDWTSFILGIVFILLAINVYRIIWAYNKRNFYRGKAEKITQRINGLIKNIEGNYSKFKGNKNE